VSPGEQEQHETAEVAAAVFPDSAVQVFYDPLHYSVLDVAHERFKVTGWHPVSDRIGLGGMFHLPVLLSHFMSPARLTKIYM
jgi:hypothetical protein